MLNDDSIEFNFRNMAHTRTWRISIVFEYDVSACWASSNKLKYLFNFHILACTPFTGIAYNVLAIFGQNTISDSMQARSTPIRIGMLWADA